MMAVDFRSLTRLLRSCDSRRPRSPCRQLHGALLKSGRLLSSLFLSNSLLHAYAGSLCDAGLLFDEMPLKNCFSWNSLLEAYLQNDDTASARRLFDAMPERNSFSWDAMVVGLARCGLMDSARRVFDEMPLRDGIACNSMISGYLRKGMVGEAFHLFKELNSVTHDPSSPQLDGFVLATAVKACAVSSLLDYGRQIHARIAGAGVELDSVLLSALINMYAKCESLDDARRLLDGMEEPDEFSLSAMVSGYASHGRLVDARAVFDRSRNPSVALWNSMIDGYSINKRGEEALNLFKRMRAEGVGADPSTIVTALGAFACSCFSNNGGEVHAFVLKLGFSSDASVATALVDSYFKLGRWEDACAVFHEVEARDTILLNSMINAYSKCGKINEARRVFDDMSSRSLISWNSMIVGYSQNGCSAKALELLGTMRRLGLILDNVALASAISACASIPSLRLGQQIFAYAMTSGLHSDCVISTSFINLYCKCGRVAEGRTVFDGLRNADGASWNTMLIGYASNGYGHEALGLFEAMRSASVPLDEATFVGVLSACCHCGLTEQGLRWFRAMEDYGIAPRIEHCSCVVDLLARAGRLGEAVEFMEEKAANIAGTDASMWTAVLEGCKAHGDHDLGRKVERKLMEVADAEHAGACLQVSGVYAAKGDWERSLRVREMMWERSMSKIPGCSWVHN